MNENIKIKVNTMTETTKIKMKDAEGKVVCYITYNPTMNTLGISNSQKAFIKWVPLGD